MLTFLKKRTFRNAYATATIDVLYDTESDDIVHFVRTATTIDGRRTVNVDRAVRSKDIADDVVAEAVGIIVDEAIKR